MKKMLHTNISKLEMAKNEIGDIGVKIEKAMKKLEMILNVMQRLEEEEKEERY